MTNIKFTFTITCLVLSITNIFAQSLSFSPDVEFSQDENVVQIKEFWQSYVSSQVNNSINNQEFWSESNIDIMKFSAGDFPIYSGDNTVQSIRKVNQNGLYEINSTYEINIPGKEKPIIFMLYKVYISKEGEDYKLHNYFDIAKESMEAIKTENIELYFAHERTPKRKKVNELLRFYYSFTKSCKITQNHNITIVVANSIDEAWSYLGVPYTVHRSEDPSAGVAIKPSIILTTRENHIHELVHAILSPLNSNIPQWLDEGMATYYGGVGDKEFTEYLDLFNAHLKEYGNNDIFEREFLYSPIMPNVAAQYILGALIVDYIITTHGYEMLSNTLLCTSTEEVLKLLNISREESYNWINELIL